MTLAALGLAALALIACAATLVYAVRFMGRLEQSLERPTPLVGHYVQVNTRRPDDQTLRGLCVEEFPDGGLLLAAAEYLDAGSPPLDAGDVYLPGGSVAFVQRDVVREDGSSRPPLPRAA